MVKNHIWSTYLAAWYSKLSWLISNLRNLLLLLIKVIQTLLTCLIIHFLKLLLLLNYPVMLLLTVWLIRLLIAPLWQGSIPPLSIIDLLHKISLRRLNTLRLPLTTGCIIDLSYPEPIFSKSTASLHRLLWLPLLHGIVFIESVNGSISLLSHH